MNRVQNPGGIPVDPRLGRTHPIGQTAPKRDAPSRTGRVSPFGRIFQEELKRGQGLRFSAHAQNRLSARGIQLSPETVERLVDAVDRAAAKGARDALVLLPGLSRGEDLAFVVSVTNRTVVTAVDGEHLRENVFTNIDSAVIAGDRAQGTGSIPLPGR